MTKITIALLAFCFQINAQELERVYLDSVFEKTTEGKHHYYRTVTQDEEGYLSRTYYASGKIFRQGRSQDITGSSLHGWVREFYETGGRKAQIQYEKGKEVGSVQRWYEDGKPRLVGYWKKYEGETENTLMIAEFWDDKGVQTVTAGNGFYSDIYEGLSESGQLINERRTGIWKGEDITRKLTFEETYADGKLVTGLSNDESGAEYRYDKIMQRPEYPGGINAFYKFVQQNFRTPFDSPGGRMIVKFHVDIDGDISDLFIINCSHKPTQDAVIDMFIRIPKWIPARIRGRDFRCEFTLPIVLAMPE